MSRLEKIKPQVIETLKTIIDAYPQIIPMLYGSAAWCTRVMTYKLGDPNEEARMQDERRLERNVRKFLSEQFDRVIDEIKKKDAIGRDVSEKSIFQPSFWDQEHDKMWDALAGDFVGILMHGIDEGIISLGSFGGAINPDMINQAIIDYATRYKNEWMYKMTDTARQAVQKAMINWLQSNEGLDTLIKLLEPTFGKVRAARIAATEVTRLRAKANQLTWQESGVVRQFRWSTANDDLVCQICGPREGMLFPLADMTSMLPAHVNCRCVGRPVVDEDLFEQQQREILGLGEEQ